MTLEQKPASSGVTAPQYRTRITEITNPMMNMAKKTVWKLIGGECGVISTAAVQDHTFARRLIVSTEKENVNSRVLAIYTIHPGGNLSVNIQCCSLSKRKMDKSQNVLVSIGKVKENRKKYID